ncbi:site-specific integrase [Micromonospora sp. R77]|uniref:tyrosine-type recombinase/integrase n=1 Tax=Micromonospora sp. R77 TaxID=2925836 RepID=UPI001F601561|nr:tyrosine-type recombinase/integrase [Micromonospora sp. R77]MCI4061298.1 site-specific integrase [Micromonospora sp. R77]
MPLLDLQKLTVGLSRTWSGFLRDWDRSLRAGNYPQTTRYNYPLAAAQLGRYLREHWPDPDAEDAAEDPCAVTRAHVEAFQAWMIDTRSASTALNKHKGLQQFFKWLLVDEQAVDRSPMERVRQPKTPRKLIPLMRDEDTGKLLDACKGKSFANLRDEALIRLYCNTGARLSEVGNLLMTDIDLNTESVRFHGKGAKDRRVRFGPKTARALSRYRRARGKHKGAALPAAWSATTQRKWLKSTSRRGSNCRTTWAMFVAGKVLTGPRGTSRVSTKVEISFGSYSCEMATPLKELRSPNQASHL